MESTPSRRRICLLLAVAASVALCLAQSTDFPTTARSVPLPAAPRPWGPEQATGAPDTPTPGDHPTAWASLTPDDQDEWLELDYAPPITPVLIRVYETFNPGAVSAIGVAGADGKTVEVWSGQDPTWPGVAGAISEFPVKVNFPVQRVRLEIASSEIPGWNEIDAVGLVDADGKVQWAKSARASSTYADQVRQQSGQQRTVPADGAAPLPQSGIGHDR